MQSNTTRLNQNNFHSEVLNGLYKKKHKKFQEMKNLSDDYVQKSIINKSEKNKSFDVYKKNYDHEQTQADDIFNCKTKDLSNFGINGEVLNGLFKKKKKKHKIFEDTNNISDDNVQKSINNKSEKNKSFDVYKKKYDHEQSEADETSNCKTEDLHNFGISGEILNGLHKKKKEKRKMFEETKNISDDYVKKSINNKSEKNKSFDVYKKNYDHEQTEADDISNCKTEDLSNFGISGEILNGLYKKKKKKRQIFEETENISDDYIKSIINKSEKNKSFDVYKKNYDHAEADDISNYKTEDLSNFGISGENLNGLYKKKKKKRKIFEETENISDDYVQKSIINKSEKNKSFNSSNESFDKINKSKTKKYRHKNPGLEYILEPTIELNKDSNNNLNAEHINRDKEKSIGKKPVEQRTSKLCKESKKQVRSGAKVTADNFLENEKDDCKVHKKEKIKQENNIYTSFDVFTCDMTEVPVPFPVPLLHEDETGATIGQEKKAYLEENGVEIFTGKWTKIEDDILTRNFQQFGLEFGVNNPFQLFGINQTKKNMELVKFLKAKHFWLRLGKDLNNRPLRSIYMRARKLFNPLKTQEKLSVEEASDLKSAYQLVGNKWTRISDMLSRSDFNCHTAYRWYKSDINKGKWTPEEESTLIKAIKTVSGTDDISAKNVKNIPWKTVANYVGTRNEFQCHKQWAEHLAWDSSVTERKPWEQQHFGKLIYLIKDKYCFNSESAIDFKQLHKHFNDVTPSYISLRKKWLYLKGRVPKELKSNYSKYLNALARMYKEQYKIFATEKK